MAKRFNVLAYINGERIEYRNVSAAISRIIGIWIETRYSNHKDDYFVGSRHYFISANRSK